MKLRDLLSPRMLFSGAVLCATLYLVFLSWSSSRTLSFVLSGYWHSGSEPVHILCEDKKQWESTCSISSEIVNYTGVISAWPLSEGGWYWTTAHNGSVICLQYRSGILTLTFDSGGGVADAFSLQRKSSGHSEDAWTILKAKGRYIAALFLLIGTYKWITIASSPSRSSRRARLDALRSKKKKMN